MHMKSLKDYSLFENMILLKYNRRREMKRKKKSEAWRNHLLNRKMVFVLGKALHHNGGAE